MTVAALSIVVSAAPAQPVTRLTTPSVEFSPELTTITGVQELSDGRLVLLDRKEKKLLVISAAGQVTSLAREGSGPGEFLRPYALVPLRGDTTLIEDDGNSRYLVLARGRVATTLPLIRMHPQENVTYTVTPRGADEEGRLYVLTPTGLAKAERIPILRLDRATEKLDTVGSIRNDRFGVQPGAPAMRANGASFGMMASRPWAIKDEWTVAPDGYIAVAHNEPYSVDWVGPDGKVASGAPIVFTAVRVTEAEREAWRQQQRDNAGTLTTTDASGKTTSRKMVAPEPEAWPATMPAFSGPSAVVAGPDGTVWIERLRGTAATSVQYDVVDRKGTVIERVELPLGHRVIGFGKESVYVVRTDDDGLQHLQRYARR
jgi:hypothetical protein